MQRDVRRGGQGLSAGLCSRDLKLIRKMWVIHRMGRTYLFCTEFPAGFQPPRLCLAFSFPSREAEPLLIF